MTPRERFIAALERRPLQQPPDLLGDPDEAVVRDGQHGPANAAVRHHRHRQHGEGEEHSDADREPPRDGPSSPGALQLCHRIMRFAPGTNADSSQRLAMPPTWEKKG